MITKPINMSNHSLNRDEIYYKTKMIDFIINNKDTIFISEFPFNFQKRRADLLLIENGFTHAIEIKSDIDNINSLNSQLNDYIESFNKVSIFISEKHVDAINNISKNIGVFVLKNDQIIHKRKALPKKRLNKRILLDMLSTKILKELIEKKEKMTRIEMIDLLSNKITFDSLNEIVKDYLHKKISPTYKLFLSERINQTTIHDLMLLEIRNTTL
ncbi:sce7726 family protein [Photobacterium ganghwense]|uniref:sce7726 family protein n=1 Tax=Photobacterium ganghwense TaxID=320778 RepID=UPI0039EF9326